MDKADNQNLNTLANELLSYPAHTAIRFSFDGKSCSYPMERFHALATEWIEQNTFASEAKKHRAEILEEEGRERPKR